MKFKAEQITVGLLSAFLILVSVLPNFKLLLKTPKGTEYTFFHNSISDYPYYISFTRQGLFRNTVIDQFTTEAQSEGLIHIFYLILGKAGGIFALSPVVTYFISRIILGFVFLMTGYKLISLFLDKPWQRVTAFLLFITSSSFPKVINLKNGLDLWPYLYWWTEMDPWQRATFIPHFLMGHIGLAGMITMLVFLFRTGKVKFLFGSVLLGFITGLAHPPSLGMVYYIFGAYLLLILIDKTRHFFIRQFRSILKIKDKKSNIKNSEQKIINLKFTHHTSHLFSIMVFSMFVLLTIPSLVYIYKTTGSVFPWTLMKAQESLFYFVPLDEYLLSIGIILPLGIFGIFISIINKEIVSKRKDCLILILWIVIDILMIPFSYLISTTPVLNMIPTFANIRFLSMAIQLPLSVLSVIFLTRIHRFRKVFWTVIMTYMIFTLPMNYSTLKAQLTDFIPMPLFVYPPAGLTEVFRHLDNNTRSNDAVLANAHTSLLLPLYAKNKVYFGQSIYTLNNGGKSEEASRFFEGIMDECSVLELFSKNGIMTVISVNKKEKNVINKYDLFKEYYSSFDGEYTVYKMKENRKTSCKS